MLDLWAKDDTLWANCEMVWEHQSPQPGQRCHMQPGRRARQASVNCPWPIDVGPDCKNHGQEPTWPSGGKLAVNSSPAEEAWTCLLLDLLPRIQAQLVGVLLVHAPIPATASCMSASACMSYRHLWSCIKDMTDPGSDGDCMLSKMFVRRT